MPLLRSHLCGGGLGASVGAARRWGHPVRASIELHRFELNEKLGLRCPATSEESREVGVAINRMLLYREAIPDRMLAGREPSGKAAEES